MEIKNLFATQHLTKQEEANIQKLQQNNELMMLLQLHDNIDNICSAKKDGNGGINIYGIVSGEEKCIARCSADGQIKVGKYEVSGNQLVERHELSKEELNAVREQMRMAIRNRNAEISDEDVKLYHYAQTNTDR